MLKKITNIGTESIEVGVWYETPHGVLNKAIILKPGDSYSRNQYFNFIVDTGRAKDIRTDTYRP